MVAHTTVVKIGMAKIKHISVSSLVCTTPICTMSFMHLWYNQYCNHFTFMSALILELIDAKHSHGDKGNT